MSEASALGMPSKWRLDCTVACKPEYIAIVQRCPRLYSAKGKALGDVIAHKVNHQGTGNNGERTGGS